MQRLALAAVLCAGIVAAWAFLLHGAGMSRDMPAMAAMQGMQGMPGTADRTVRVLVMWAAMMIAMMLPGAAPALVARGAVFAAGYVVVWTAFGAGATVLHLALERAGALSAGMALRSAPIAALAIAVVGVYELTPLKTACLRHCRWAAGPHRNAALVDMRARLAHGMRYGLFCVGCCWALMLLLFAGGVMNFVWMTALTLFVLAEKVLPRPVVLARFAGAALIAFGALAPYVPFAAPK